MSARTSACAHRGDSGRLRENTLPAIRSAIDAGAEFVEIDVRLTADGGVVVLHDPTLSRLWNVDAAVAEVTAAEVAAMSDGDLRIPTLAEVLVLFEDCPSTLLIDMETAEPAAAAHRVVAEAGASVAWCGDLDGMRTIRRLDGSARIWMPWSGPQSPTEADVRELRPEFINSHYLSVTRTAVDEIHALGCKVAVWTVDDELTMRWALSIGVDSVTTNELPTLQRVIAEDETITEEDVMGQPAGEGEDAAGPGSGVDLEHALAVARQLGEWAIDFARTSDPGLISTKLNPADLVTEVDIAVERHVREIIGHQFSGHGFVGEEMGGNARAGVPCWYLDPVDGTTNFANRVPWNAFSLALVVDETPLVGVVADPWRGDLFEAVRGGGSKLNGAPLTIPAGTAEGDPLAGRVVSTELAAHLAWPGMLTMLKALGARHCTMRIMGSGTMTLVGIAAGRGVGAVIGRFGPVDHLAAALVVAEAGGVVLDSRGQPNLFPSSGGILAAAPHAASELYELWQAACAAETGSTSTSTSSAT